MSPLTSTLKSLLPMSVRDAARYCVNVGYRRMVRHQRARARHEHTVVEAKPRLWEQTGGVVVGGPFKGLRYVEEAVGSAWAPKMLGTYEMEVRPALEALIARRPARVIDLGAAEGYYAVGLLVRLGAARVVAFEADEASHPILRQLAERNGVADRLTVAGLCTPGMLADVLSHEAHPAIICDVEGAEDDLLDPACVAGLARADILVELHEFARPGIAAVMRDRFGKTHHIERIESRPRSPEDFPPAIQLDEVFRGACMDERRPGAMSWLWMTPNSAAGTPPA